MSIIENQRINKDSFNTPVVIVAGGASLMDEPNCDNYRDMLRELMQGFKGTIISGGTTAGIPGLVGEVKSELEKSGRLDFELIGYLPKNLPDMTIKSTAYDCFYETDSDHFSVLEVLTYWSDIVLSGIDPKEVLLIGIEGGPIAAMEYRIALSLGAKVALLANSGRAASDLLQDEAWSSHPNLVLLSEEPVSIRALIHPPAGHAQ
jgi:hypothetical protein